MNLKIIDNFLDFKNFQIIQDAIYGADLPWFQNRYLVYENEIEENNTWNWQLTHTFYNQNMPRSDKFFLLEPIITRLNPGALVRVKANLIPRTDKIIVHPYHVDIDNFKGKTAVYYINSNNGYTLFKDGSNVESIENRMVIFDSILEHTGTSCTNARNRCVINFNFYEW